MKCDAWYSLTILELVQRASTLSSFIEGNVSPVDKFGSGIETFLTSS